MPTSRRDKAKLPSYIKAFLRDDWIKTAAARIQLLIESDCDVDSAKSALEFAKRALEASTQGEAALCIAKAIEHTTYYFEHDVAKARKIQWQKELAKKRACETDKRVWPLYKKLANKEEKHKIATLISESTDPKIPVRTVRESIARFKKNAKN